MTESGHDWESALDSAEGGEMEDVLELLDAFEGYESPSGYSVSADLIINSDGKPVCRVPVVVMRRFVDITTGLTTAMELRWLDPDLDPREGDYHTETFPLADLSDALRLRRHAGVLPVTSVTASRFIAYIEAVRAANRERIPVERATSLLGWLDDAAEQTYFIPGAGEEDVHIVGMPANARQMAEACGRAGTLEGWKQATALLAGHPKAQLPMMANLAASVARMLDQPGFVLHQMGLSSSGKTATVQVGVSTHGPPGMPGQPHGDMVATWDTTEAAAVERMSVCRGFPVTFDETKVARDDSLLRRIVYAVVTGRERGRSSPGRTVTCGPSTRC